MARAPTGSVVVERRKRGRVFALRFRAYGKRQYVTLGTADEGWTPKRAEVELENVLADVRRGIWRAPEPEPEPPEPKRDPTFHEFASEWFDAKRRELRPGTVTAYEWQLSHHLLPFFARHRLSRITVAEVDRYRAAKVREADELRRIIEAGGAPGRKPLSGESINKTIGRLGQVLEVAVEYGYLDRNPATGRRRRLKVAKPRSRYLDRAAHIAALLDAAETLDRGAKGRQRQRRPLLATLVFGGLRIGEALALRWRDVDLPHGRLHVGDAKTDAGVRYVPLAPALHADLRAHKARARFAEPDDLVFCTRTGGRLSKDNTRQRYLQRSVERADEALTEAGEAPISEGLTQHSMRHTYISLRMALGHDLAGVSRDAGHADMSVTYRIYTHVMRLDEGERERLKALWEGADWAAMGSGRPNGVPNPSEAATAFGSRMRPERA